jgi:hypothetical protein
MLMCAECHCIKERCIDGNSNNCTYCVKAVCCCIRLHTNQIGNKRQHVLLFFSHVRTLFAAALGIEMLCIMAAEIGENSGLYYFGYDLHGIIIAYIMGYALAGFSTFVTILGRYNFKNNTKVETCCSVLDQQSNKGFLINLLTTFRNFQMGISKLPVLYRQPNIKQVLKTSLIILVTAESACILTAETIDLVFYKQSIFLSVTLALLAGSFTVVAPEAYKKTKSLNSKCKNF